ncbi:MAG: hypothetical protein QOD58_3984, partial [Mycobacterium sp.]|nr:hypothetical protein [Mycobacterium sp.]
PLVVRLSVPLVVPLSVPLVVPLSAPLVVPLLFPQQCLAALSHNAISAQFREGFCGYHEPTAK